MRHEYCCMLARLSLSIQDVEKEDVESAIAKAAFERAPERTPEIYGTDFPFKLSAILDKKNKKVSPQILAGKLVRAAVENEPFALSDPGTGHINASPRNIAVDAFQQAITQNPTEFIFGFQSACSPKGSFAFAKPRHPREMMRNLSRLIEKSKNEDVILVRDQAEDGVDTMIMIAALLGDRDLDSATFLSGLQGRENVPWFFRKFLVDTETFVENVPVGKTHQSLVLSNEQIKEGPYRYQTKLPNSTKEAAGAYLLELFELRSHYALALNQGNPSLWCNYLLGLVKRFYAFYNLPQYRDLSLLEADDVAYLGQLSAFVQAAQRVLKCWLEQLSACEN